MVMTIATNCSNTRNRISFWDRLGDPPRIMLRRPSSSTSATAPTAIGRRIELRNDAIGGTYPRARPSAIARIERNPGATIWLLTQLYQMVARFADRTHLPLLKVKCEAGS